MLSSLKLFLKTKYLLFKTIRRILAATGFFKKKVYPPTDEFWNSRISIVLQAPDNNSIDRSPYAGKIIGDTQVMHNGIKIHVGSYYGDGMTALLFKNRGVHEPQEEKAFAEVLKFLPAGSTMLELGAFWGFYSLTFRHSIPKGINYLIEPNKHALLSGKYNFKLNKVEGHFFNYYVSDKSSPGNVPSISLDDFLNGNDIAKLNILHCDIQGYELKMLVGGESSLRAGIIDYIFISTHSNSLHENCKLFLSGLSYVILCNANIAESFSEDGLIVAKHRSVFGPESIKIHLRK